MHGKLILIFLLCSMALFAQSATQTVISVASPGELGYGATFSQDLGVSPAQLQEYQPGYANDGIYKLKFTAANKFLAYPGYYTVKLSFGSQELCESSGWGNASPSEIPVVCQSPHYLVIYQSQPGGGPVQGSHNLVITWTVNDGSFNGGWPIVFGDNVSLTFTPE